MKSSVADLLKEYVRYLKSNTDRAKRELVADQLADVLERAISNPAAIDGAVLKEAVNDIMSLALGETDSGPRESLLHALVNASSLADAKEESLDFEPIAQALDTFNEAELEYGLYILGFSRRLDYLAIIERYLDHPSANVRTVANQARAEIIGSD